MESAAAANVGRPAALAELAWPASSAGAGIHLQQPDVSIKYYLVQPPVDGQREYLYGIAAATLGNGNRYMEIYQLNKDRTQPDGARLVDPLDLRPGWVLVLPADAKGPDVRTGALPGSTPATATTPTASAPPPTLAAPVGDPSGTNSSGYLQWIGAFGLVVILLAVVLRVIRRSRSNDVPELLPSPIPPMLPAPSSHAVDRVAPPVAAQGATVAASVINEASVVSVAAERVGSASEASSVAAERVGSASEASSVAAEQVGPAPEVGVVDGLRATVHSGGDRLDVRLTGAEEHLAYGWVEPPGKPSADGLRVVVGDAAHGTLWVDVSHASDVLTITGALEASQRQALALARQVHATGSNVIFVGGALEPDAVPLGCRWVATFPEPQAAVGPGRGSGRAVVISLGLRGAELRAARQLMARTDRLAVPIMIGSVLRARWSIAVVPDDE
ncbi:hypothetical protein A6A27_40170 [Micromonospora sp. CB01531]|nr:hypothetical protein A6A27_40170 [Micromonospora sp. CB01531]